MTGPVPPSDEPTQAPPSESAPPPVAPPPMAPPPAPMPAMPAMAVRPGMVTAAGIVMIVIGALITLFGLLSMLVGGILGGAASGIDFQAPGFGGFAGAAAGALIVFALILLAIGILDIVAGANVMGGRGWARITGIVLAVILALFSLSGLGSGDGTGTVFSLIWLAANAFIIWGLATSGSWFAARSS